MVNHVREQQRSGGRPAAPSEICVFWSLVRYGEFAGRPDVGEAAAIEPGLECMRIVRPRARSHIVYKALSEGQAFLVGFLFLERRLAQWPNYMPGRSFQILKLSKSYLLKTWWEIMVSSLPRFH